MEVNWVVLKNYYDQTSADSYLFHADLVDRYCIFCINGIFNVSAWAKKGCRDAKDFEDNYKSISNVKPDQYVTTELEKDKGDFKMGSALKSFVVADGLTHSFTMKIPGTYPAVGRLMFRGDMWVGTATGGDRAYVQVTDEDNILGAGAGLVVGDYRDTDMDAANQGHYLKNGEVSLGGIAGYGPAVGGLYLKTTLVVPAARNDTIYANVHWLKPK